MQKFAVMLVRSHDCRILVCAYERIFFAYVHYVGLYFCVCFTKGRNEICVDVTTVLKLYIVQGEARVKVFNMKKFYFMLCNEVFLRPQFLDLESIAWSYFNWSVHLSLILFNWLIDHLKCMIHCNVLCLITRYSYWYYRGKKTQNLVLKMMYLIMMVKHNTLIKQTICSGEKKFVSQTDLKS